MYTVASAPTVAGAFIMRRFRLLSGQFTKYFNSRTKKSFHAVVLYVTLGMNDCKCYHTLLHKSTFLK